MTHFAALIGYQRSGTHMIGGAVDSHPDAVYANEVFWHKAPETKAELDTALKPWAGEERLVFLDVKLNQITPVVEEFLCAIPVISIYRRDRRRHYYSGKLHHYRHTKNGGQPVRERVAFPFEQSVFDDIEQAVSSLYSRYGYLAHLRLVYEDITGNENVVCLSPDVSRAICEALALPVRQLQTKTVKEAPQDIRGLLL